MRQFKIPQYPYEEDRKMFSKTELELEPNTVTCLVGCNGTGKTTALHFIKRALEKSGAVDRVEGKNPYAKAVHAMFGDEEFDFTVKEDHIVDFSKRSEFATNDLDFMMGRAAVAFSSTGEGVISRFGKILQVLGSVISEDEMENKNLFIFFDDCDAGTSLDVICEIKDVVNLICNDCKSRKINYYFILTANSYEMCKDYDCVDITNFKHVKFKDYEDYKKFVLKTRKYKNKELAKQEE